jgi:hypothetical protein
MRIPYEGDDGQVAHTRGCLARYNGNVRMTGQQQRLSNAFRVLVGVFPPKKLKPEAYQDVTALCP